MLRDDELLALNHYDDDPIVCETDEDILRFARAVEKASYAAAIKACENLENRVIRTHPARIEFDPNSLMARKCAGAIRSLMKENSK